MNTFFKLYLLAMLPCFAFGQPASDHRSNNILTTFENHRNGKFVADSTYYYDWMADDQQWENFERYIIRSRDQYGNLRSSVSFGIDPVSADWFEEQRYEAGYYDSITQKYWISEIWDAKDGSWRMSDSIFYTTTGRPSISWFKIWDPFKFRFSRGRLINYAYTSGNQTLKEEIKAFDTLSGNWANHRVISFTYDDDLLLTKKTTAIWREDGSLTDTLRSVLEYNEQQQVVSDILQRFVAGAWQNHRKAEIVYNKAGNTSQLFEYVWKPAEGEWEYVYFWRFSYNAQGLLEQTLQQYWFADLNEWYEFQRTTYQYNDQGKRSEVLQEVYDHFGQMWTKIARDTYAYDENGNRTNYTYQIWNEDNGSWQNFYKFDNWWSFFEPASIFHPEKISLMVFPNPSSGAVTVSIGEPFTHCSLHTLQQQRHPRQKQAQSITSQPRWIYPHSQKAPTSSG
jgi:hypothetical protein